MEIKAWGLKVGGAFDEVFLKNSCCRFVLKYFKNNQCSVSKTAQQCETFAVIASAFLVRTKCF
jgi:hypothetical protein